ncbi:Ribonuclease BN, tRNA processing enzyme [Lentibacillus halodurans]|uniref:Ribonuclease BN, tRNA processing enzyme n=1 Tax=Lentibacillus halodurans TaxID=237679 RepID=A0A1I0VZD0_9BACI|nr:MBL fold metallo-hydrolase [Lentibacillus halodurans]SFA81815.1 Ribonuclease BN, tRNA processing enzyme [Lentibacillus halodurans]
MKLTIIGCWGGYPAPGGATSAYMLEQDDFTLLIDAGSGSLSKLQSMKHVMNLDAVILSHYHNDHIADIGVLQYAWLVQSYMSDRKEVLPIYGHQEDQYGFKSLTHKHTEGVAYDPAATLEVGPFSITFLKTVHPVPCYGMRITNGEDVIVYTADTAFKEAWYDFAKDADLLVTDCNFYADQDGSAAGHMTSKEGAMIADKANVDELILSHLPQYRDNNDLVKEAKAFYSGSIQLAKEGLVWGKSHNF